MLLRGHDADAVGGGFEDLQAGAFRQKHLEGVRPRHGNKLSTPKADKRLMRHRLRQVGDDGPWIMAGWMCQAGQRDARSDEPHTGGDYEAHEQHGAACQKAKDKQEGERRGFH